VGRIGIARRPAALPPAVLAPCAVRVPPNTVLPAIRSMSDNELASTAIVEQAPVSEGGAAGLALPPGSLGCARGGRAEVVSYRPERVVVATHSSAASVLVLSDTWFPGWTASVDGRQVPVLQVDHALRGAIVGPGDHQVRFTYRPSSFGKGLRVTTTTILILFATWAFARRSSRQTRSLPAD
jgi:hypothetical protein